MFQAPRLPQYPTDPAEMRHSWNEMVRVLTLFHQRIPVGAMGSEYTIIGTIPASVTLDLTNITVTAVAETLARLLKDMKNYGIIDVKEL